MKKSAFLILILGTLFAKAQVPGYQGLRFSVKYDCGIMHPAILAHRGTLPYIFHNVSLEYVVTRSISIGLMYTYMGYNGPPNKFGLPANATVDNVSLNPADYPGKYSQHCLAFIGKKFFRRRGFIAPVGRYISSGAYYQYAVDRSIYIPRDSYGTLTGSPGGIKGTASIPGIIFGVGRNFIVADRLIIDFGGNINVACFAPSGPEENKVTYRDIFFNNLFQLYVGLGVLAF
jgi:hypothetical protein